MTNKELAQKLGEYNHRLITVVVKLSHKKITLADKIELRLIHEGIRDEIMPALEESAEEKQQ